MTGDPTILLVDDEQPILDFYNTVLTNSGYACTCFTDPLAALETLKRRSFDLIITDNKMPGMTGIELLEEIMELELQAQARRMMISGSYGTQDQMNSILDNELAHRMLGKPIGMTTFLDAVKEQLAFK